MLIAMLDWMRRTARRLQPKENDLYREVREAREAYANVRKAGTSAKRGHDDELRDAPHTGCKTSDN